MAALISENVVTLSIFVSEHLDFMNQVDLKELNIQPFGQVHHDYIGYQSLTDVPKAIAYSEAEYDLTQSNKLNSTAELIDTQCQMSIVFAKSMRSTPVMPCVSFRNFHSRYTYTYVKP